MMNDNHKLAYTHYSRGGYYAKQGLYNLAIESYTLVIKLIPHSTTVYNFRGNAYYEKGDYDLAIADYTQAIILNPFEFEAYYNRGNVYSTQGLYDQARKDYEKVVEYNPDFSSKAENGLKFIDEQLNKSEKTND